MDDVPRQRAETPLPFEPDPVIEAYKKDVDRTLIRENLKLTPQQRLDQLVAQRKFAYDLRAAMERARHESSARH
jgi:hypothetical protein